MKRFYFLTLGCPKNAVDTEAMRGLLQDAGWDHSEDAAEADLLIVNTCGFIEPARRESLAALRQLAQGKVHHQRLLAAGCLAQRYGGQLQQTLPGVDGVLGTREWANIVPCAEELFGAPPRSPRRPPSQLSLVGSMKRLRPGASAYIKIADGCSAPCAFCAIPLIKGPQRSKPRESILDEARQLADAAVQEVILVAQDTTAYGRDLGEPDGLPTLMEALLATMPQVAWLRLMYAYPQHVTARLIETMATNRQVCHYLDLPLQHAHPDTLRRMRRSSDIDHVRRLIRDLRKAMPDISVRTTFIVGYPGESEGEFQALLEFLAEMRFDKVGIFVYSPEENTAAACLPQPVSREVAVSRYARAMALQQRISLARNREQIGRILEVLVEGTDSGVSLGRSYRDAPEIDGYVLIPGEWSVGRMLRVRIEQATEYDLHGRVLESEP